MSSQIILTTDRLHLRGWSEPDVDRLEAIFRNEEVTRYLGPLEPGQARGAYDRMIVAQRDHGMCFWVMERKADGAFLGYCGLQPGRPPIEGKIEIGWTLRRDAWGQGYAREAAEASLAWGWANSACPQIWAVTNRDNARSWGLMERIGMRREADWDFDHADHAEDDPLRHYITYSIGRPR